MSAYSSFAYGATADSGGLGPIAGTCVATVETTYDAANIKRLHRANKSIQMSLYPVADSPETFNIEIGEIVLTSASRHRAQAARDALVKSSVNGEGYEATSKAAAMPEPLRSLAVERSVAKNTRYYGVAQTGCQFAGGGLEDKCSVQVAGTVTLNRSRTARREFVPGDRIVARVVPSGKAGLPAVTGDDVAGIPTNKFVMEPHPEDATSVADDLLAHARLVQYDAALYRSYMGDDATTDALLAATGDFATLIRLAALAGIRQALRDGQLVVADGASMLAAAAGTDVAARAVAAAADASAPGATADDVRRARERLADSVAAIMGELYGVTSTRTLTPDAATRRTFGLGASRIVDTVLFDGSQGRDEFGVEFNAAGRPVAFRGRYEATANAVNKSSIMGALVTVQANAARRALQAVAAMHLEQTKNYMGKAMTATNCRGATRFDAFLGVH